MPHWSDKYVGRKYVTQDYDCSCLAAEVSEIEFGKIVDLPITRGINAIGQHRVLVQNKERLTEKVETPEDGDIVLMIGGGRLNHLGVYYKDNDGNAWVLHNCENAKQVVRTRLRSLSVYGFKLEGFYRWI
jgi:hypothetical protein